MLNLAFFQTRGTKFQGNAKKCSLRFFGGLRQHTTTVLVFPLLYWIWPTRKLKSFGFALVFSVPAGFYCQYVLLLISDPGAVTHEIVVPVKYRSWIHPHESKNWFVMNDDQQLAASMIHERLWETHFYALLAGHPPES